MKKQGTASDNVENCFLKGCTAAGLLGGLKGVTWCGNPNFLHAGPIVRSIAIWSIDHSGLCAGVPRSLMHVVKLKNRSDWLIGHIVTLGINLVFVVEGCFKKPHNPAWSSFRGRL